MTRRTQLGRTLETWFIAVCTTFVLLVLLPILLIILTIAGNPHP